MSKHHEISPDPHHDVYSKTLFGFWIYLLTDFVLFGVLFATYAVLHKSYFNGPTPSDIFDLRYTLSQTLVLLTSAYTIGLASNFLHRKNRKAALLLFSLTFILGLVFFLMQLNEFSGLVRGGANWSISAYLSAYFTVIGIFLIHLFFALLWVIVFLFPLIKKEIDDTSIKRLTCLKMFWQFLNVIWIFIFSLIYLLGAQ